VERPSWFGRGQRRRPDGADRGVGERLPHDRHGVPAAPRVGPGRHELQGDVVPVSEDEPSTEEPSVISSNEGGAREVR
jgi:hypothetical protein